jgi:hypothetical protein
MTSSMANDDNGNGSVLTETHPLSQRTASQYILILWHLPRPPTTGEQQIHDVAATPLVLHIIKVFAAKHDAIDSLLQLFLDLLCATTEAASTGYFTKKNYPPRLSRTPKTITLLPTMKYLFKAMSTLDAALTDFYDTEDTRVLTEDKPAGNRDSTPVHPTPSNNIFQTAHPQLILLQSRQHLP